MIFYSLLFTFPNFHHQTSFVYLYTGRNNEFRRSLMFEIKFEIVMTDANFLTVDFFFQTASVLKVPSVMANLNTCTLMPTFSGA